VEDDLKRQLPGIGTYKLKTTFDMEIYARFMGFLDAEPRAFERDPSHDHVTASAFVVSKDLTSVVLTHHVKLDKWLQLRGHCDGLVDAAFVAQKEAYEESGLSRIRLLTEDVIDLDIHEIPAREADPAHLHFDVRYLFQAEQGRLCSSAESHDLAWVPLEALEEYSDEPSLLRLHDKAVDMIEELSLSGGA